MSAEIELNESNEDNISLNQAEVRNSKKSCCCTLRRTLIFCSVLFGNCVICCLIILVIMGVLFSGLSSIRDVDYEGEPWPVTDEEGYYQSYKNNGSAWVNWWQRDMPSGLTIMAGFAFNEDQSNIPRASELDKTLPVSKPYWLNDSEPIDQKDSTQDNLKATWIGHATVLVEIDGATVLTDPIFSRRCFPVQWAGPKRYRPPACTVQELPEIVDAVVISHTHYDHLDLNSVKQLHQRYEDRIHWFVPGGSRSWFESLGISSENIHDLVWWQSKVMPLSGGKIQDPNSEDSARIVFTPGNHWSGRFPPLDRNKALWGSWLVVGSKGSKFWFGGDTAYSDVFKQIGKKFGPIDLSAIPIGAYNPRPTMKFVHVDPEEAIKIHYDLKSKMSFGIHWAAFKLTLEHYMEPKERILQMVAENPGMPPFLVPNIGETVQGKNVVLSDKTEEAEIGDL